MEIRSLSIKELQAYVFSDTFNRLEVVPITPERVISQAENPHLAPGDPALWIAESDDGRIIGFAGSLPSGEVHNNRRMGWNTCWWVDPDKGREIALPLLYKFLSYWDQHVAFADMTQHTYAIINQLDFCHTWEENLVHSYVRLSGTRILRKTGTMGKVLYPAILLAVVFINAIQQIRMSLTTKLDRHLKMEIREHIDDEIFTFIRKHRENDFLHRSMDDYRWIEDHPWLVKRSEKAGSLDKRYPFSYQVSDFGMEWVISRRDDKIGSVMLTSRRDGDLKVLYFFGEQAVDGIKVIMNRVYMDKRVQSILFCHPELLAGKGKFRSIRLFNRNRIRYVGISKRIFNDLPDRIVLQMGDGDSVFT